MHQEAPCFASRLLSHTRLVPGKQKESAADPLTLSQNSLFCSFLHGEEGERRERKEGRGGRGEEGGGRQ